MLLFLLWRHSNLQRELWFDHRGIYTAPHQHTNSTKQVWMEKSKKQHQGVDASCLTLSTYSIPSSNHRRAPIFGVGSTYYCRDLRLRCNQSSLSSSRWLFLERSFVTRHVTWRKRQEGDALTCTVWTPSVRSTANVAVEPAPGQETWTRAWQPLARGSARRVKMMARLARTFLFLLCFVNNLKCIRLGLLPAALCVAMLRTSTDET